MSSNLTPSANYHQCYRPASKGLVQSIKMPEQKIQSLDQQVKRRSSIIFPILLLGCLSILFAEIFSGASRTWFASGWGVLITFPLYLSHVLFFLWIALKLEKVSLSQLYFFGTIFALYESWITKVLWAGYSGSGTGLGTVLGIGIAEFPVLVLFWHPITSFILPILVFEILTGKILKGHDTILQKSTAKTAIIVSFLISISTFIARGNGFNLASANASLIGTLLLILGAYYLSKKSNLMVFGFSKIKFILISIYLLLLYAGGFVLLYPERMPQTLTPYLSIIISYIVLISLIVKSKKVATEFTDQNECRYSIKDLIVFALITILSSNIACIMSSISEKIFTISYFLFLSAGIAIFILATINIFNSKILKAKFS